MKKIFLLTLLFFPLFLLSNQVDKTSDWKDQFLTMEEKLYIQKKQKLLVSNENDYPPFDFAINGVARGYSVDFIKLIGRKTGLKIEFINGYSWNGLIDLFKEKKIDILHTAAKTKEREKFAIFSKPYFANKTVFVTSIDSPDIKNINEFNKKRIVVGKGWAQEEYLKKNYPQIELIKVDSAEDILLKVSNHEAEGAVFTEATAKYMIKDMFIPNLKLSGWFKEYDTNKKNLYYLLIQKENEILRSIINKVIESLTPGEIANIEYKWFGEKKDFNKVLLTPKEISYLNKKKIIKVHNETNWPPYNFFEDGKAKGYSIDYMNLLALKAGLNVEYISGHTWDQFILMMKKNDLDVMLNIAKTPERVKYLEFAKSYKTFVDVVITRKDVNYKSLKEFENKTVAIVKGFYEEELLNKNYPKINLLLVENTLEAFKAVAFGKAEATIDGIGVLNYMKLKYDLSNLKPAFDIGDKKFQLELHIATNKKDQVLNGILKKAQDLVSDEEILRLRKKWLTLDERGSDTFLDLSYEQMEYLRGKKEIKICNDPNFAPFEFREESNLKDKTYKMNGIAIDTLKEIEKILDLKFKYIYTDNWGEALMFLKERKCDIAPATVKNRFRERYSLFTKPYINLDIGAIITKKDKPFIGSLKSISDKKISRKKDSAMINILKKEYPSIEVIETKTAQEAFFSVARGESYATVATLPVAAYYIHKYSLNDLQIAGYTPLKYDLSMAVRDDEPILRDILDKALIAIPETTHKKIYDRWTGIKVDQKQDYTLFYQIISVVVLLLLISGYWNRKLQKQTVILKETQIELEELNNTLEEKIRISVNDMQRKEKILQQQSRLAQMGEMLSMIAHQWRQPLGAIGSAVFSIQTKMLSNKYDLANEKEREKFIGYLNKKHENISSYVQFLSTTIDDFRDFFKPDKKKEEISIIDPVNKALQIVGVSMKNKGIVIKTKFEVDTKIYLYQNEMMQVILNLLKNCEDNFCEKKIQNPKIFIGTKKLNGTYIIYICDNGGGIDKDIFPKIFDPYFSTKDEKNGTGLGLYMSKIMVEEHNKGKLYAYNKSEGVCFNLEFSKRKKPL